MEGPLLLATLIFHDSRMQFCPRLPLIQLVRYLMFPIWLHIIHLGILFNCHRAHLVLGWHIGTIPYHVLRLGLLSPTDKQPRKDTY